MRLVVNKSKSVEGNDLITVRFEKETAVAAAPIIEAVYEVFIPEGMFSEVPSVLTLLSATRQDTREPVVLTPEERAACATKAAEAAASMTSDG